MRVYYCTAEECQRESLGDSVIKSIAGKISDVSRGCGESKVVQHGCRELK